MASATGMLTCVLILVCVAKLADTQGVRPYVGRRSGFQSWPRGLSRSVGGGRISRPLSRRRQQPRRRTTVLQQTVVVNDNTNILPRRRGRRPSGRTGSRRASRNNMTGFTPRLRGQPRMRLGSTSFARNPFRTGGSSRRLPRPSRRRGGSSQPRMSAAINIRGSLQRGSAAPGGHPRTSHPFSRGRSGHSHGASGSSLPGQRRQHPSGSGVGHGLGSILGSTAGGGLGNILGASVGGGLGDIFGATAGGGLGNILGPTVGGGLGNILGGEGSTIVDLTSLLDGVGGGSGGTGAGGGLLSTLGLGGGISSVAGAGQSGAGTRTPGISPGAGVGSGLDVAGLGAGIAGLGGLGTNIGGDVLELTNALNSLLGQSGNPQGGSAGAGASAGGGLNSPALLNQLLGDGHTESQRENLLSGDMGEVLASRMRAKNPGMVVDA